MNDKNLVIKRVDISDAPELLELYRPYVEKTAITFEYDVPSLDEFTERIVQIEQKYPYLLAKEDGMVLGYAYASAFKGRAAYNWSVETTVYVREDIHRKGIGHRLYEKLEMILTEQHILNLNACIAYPNPVSILFHEQEGYKKVAHFNKCGYKMGKWYDMIWMEKMLGEHPKEPLDVINWNDLDMNSLLNS